MNPGTTYAPAASSVSVALVGAETGDRAVADRDVDLEPLAREDRQDPATADDEIGGLVAAGDREPARQITRLRHQISLLASISQV